jgi:hypothetical protein
MPSGARMVFERQQSRSRDTRTFDGGFEFKLSGVSWACSGVQIGARTMAKSPHPERFRLIERMPV